MNFLWVFIGAGIGGMLRHGVNLLTLRILGSGLPLGTLFINVSGSLVMGSFAEYWAIKNGLSQPMRLFLTTGLIGGYTTFSTFSLEAVLLWERGQPPIAAAYATASVVLSIGALFCGLWLVRFLDGRGIL